jgi:predicted nicotinamide N-methyase
MTTARLPETEVLILPVGDHAPLELEQAARLDALVQESLRTGEEPFWAYVWPSARALVELVADLGDLSGRRVLDLGCGPGAAGLAAARLGAEVVLADLAPAAVALAARNAARNGLPAQAMNVDWDAPPPELGRFDVVLAADVLYGDGMLRGVLRFLKAHLQTDGIAYLADPNRVMASGVVGAARLAGLEAREHVLRPGRSIVGGVTLYALQRRGGQRR